MAGNLLLVYEIADKAARVTSKKAFKEFERWVAGVLGTYRDAAIQRVANMHLFRLKEQLHIPSLA